MEPEPIFHATANHPPLKIIDFLADYNNIVVGGMSGYLTFITFAPRYGSKSLRAAKTTITCLKQDPVTKIIFVGDKDGNMSLIGPDHSSLLKITKQHTGSINDAAFSPDGKVIATCSNDRTVKFFTFPELKLIRSNQGHFSWVNCVLFSPDGSKVITAASDRKIRIWSNKTQRLLKVFDNLPSVPTSLFFNKIDKLYYIGFMNGTIALMDINGNITATATLHKSVVTSLSYDSRRHLLLTSSDDSNISIFDTTKNVPVMTLEAHHSHVSKVCWCSDNQHFASCDASGRVLVWNMPPLEHENLSFANTEDLSFTEENTVPASVTKTNDEENDNIETALSNTENIPKKEEPKQNEENLKEESNDEETKQAEETLHEETVENTESHEIPTKSSSFQTLLSDKDEKSENELELDIHETEKVNEENHTEQQFLQEEEEEEEEKFDEKVEQENKEPEVEETPEPVKEENEDAQSESEKEEIEEKQDSHEEETQQQSDKINEEEEEKNEANVEEQHESENEEQIEDNQNNEEVKTEEKHESENEANQEIQNEDEEEQHHNEEEEQKETLQEEVVEEAQTQNDVNQEEEKNEGEQEKPKYNEEEEKADEQPESDDDTHHASEKLERLKKIINNMDNNKDIEEEDDDKESENSNEEPVQNRVSLENEEAIEHHSDNENHSNEEQEHNNEPRNPLLEEEEEEEEKNENNEEKPPEEQEQHNDENEEEENKEEKQDPFAGTDDYTYTYEEDSNISYDQSGDEPQETLNEETIHDNDSNKNTQTEESVTKQSKTVTIGKPPENDEEEEILNPIEFTQERRPFGCHAEPKRILSVLQQINSQLEFLRHTSEGMMRRAEIVQKSIDELYKKNSLI